MFASLNSMSLVVRYFDLSCSYNIFKGNELIFLLIFANYETRCVYVSS